MTFYSKEMLPELVALYDALLRRNFAGTCCHSMTLYLEEILPELVATL